MKSSSKSTLKERYSSSANNVCDSSLQCILLKSMFDTQWKLLKTLLCVFFKNKKSHACAVASCVQCPWSHSHRIICLHVPPPPEQKPQARSQPSIQHRRPGWPPLPGLPGLFGRHVWGWRTHSLHPWQPGSCQPACGAINQPDKGSLSRYIIY